MNIHVVRGLFCPLCLDFIHEDDSGVSQWFQCDHCGEIYANREEAEECCKEWETK